MPTRCVAAGCGNVKNIKEGISMHIIPFHGDERAEATRRRKKWVDFVRLKRAKWQPSKFSVLCSKHFEPEDFTRQFSNVDGSNESDILKRSLKSDDFGTCAFPTIQAVGKSKAKEKPSSDRARRKALKEAMSSFDERESYIPPDSEPTAKFAKVQPFAEAGCSGAQNELAEPVCSSSHQPDETAENTEEEEEMKGEQEIECARCTSLKSQNRILKNKILSLHGQLGRRLAENRKYRRRKGFLVKYHEANTTRDMTPAEDHEVKDETIEWDDIECDGETTVGDEEGQEQIEEEEEDGSGSQYHTETETETTETETDDDGASKSKRLSMKGKNLRTEPKHIVFLSQLLLLFKFCHVCKADNPLVETSEIGTEAVVKTTCNNPACKKEKTWYSQPLMPGTQTPAGNFLLCLSILLTGGSATRVFQMFAHMGLGCLSLNTFFKHQRNKLFPTIYLYWQKYQSSMLAKLKSVQGGITIAGDGRHDSMGHSAKFGAYTIFCCSIPMIIHFALVQRNQAGSSTGMEFMAFKQCMEYLIGYGLLITTFISDRHVSIASHMKKVLHHIVHYFDVWHLKKKIRKVLSKLSKIKGCETLTEWIKPCERHLYWSATSTFNGNGRVIWAKFKAFLSHVINKHSNFDDPLFNKCCHGEIQPRKWLKAGTLAYEKLYEALTENTLVKGIKQASPLAQTSCLEGFHSVLNYFSPKMIAYSYVGMYCRHILAAIHFNFNLQRNIKHREADGAERIKISYPKFKNGEATVRDVRIKPNFDYVEEIFQTYMETSQNDLTEAASKLREKTPDPMNAMLQKQPRQEAVQKRADRKRMVVKDVPPTTPVSQVPEGTCNQRKGTTTVRKCKQCKQPLKGHKTVVNCPRNRAKK